MKVIWEANNISLSLSVAHFVKFLRSRQNLLYLFNYFGAGLVIYPFGAGPIFYLAGYKKAGKSKFQDQN